MGPAVIMIIIFSIPTQRKNNHAYQYCSWWQIHDDTLNFSFLDELEDFYKDVYIWV